MVVRDMRFEIAHILPERRDTYTQSKQLIGSGLLHGRWLLLNATRRTKEAEALAACIATMRERAVEHRQMRGKYFPDGILLLTLDAVIFRHGWVAEYQQCHPIPHVIVIPSAKPHFQVAQILQTGIACEKIITVVYNPHLAASLNDFTVTQEERTGALVEQLHRAVLRGTVNGCRIVSPRPLGIMTCTDCEWNIAYNYTTMFTARA